MAEAAKEKVSNHELLYLKTGLVIIRDGVRVENVTPDASPLETIERLESENKELEAMVDSMKESIIHVKSEAELKWKSYVQCHELNLVQHDDFEKRLPQLQGRQNQFVEEKRELNGKLRTLKLTILDDCSNVQVFIEAVCFANSWSFCLFYSDRKELR